MIMNRKFILTANVVHVLYALLAINQLVPQYITWICLLGEAIVNRKTES